MKFNSGIDMETGPDGRIYVLEYGSGWFAKNKDAGLSRIDYNRGNRAPDIKNVVASKNAGKLPLTVTFTVSAKDPEGDKISYVWDLGNGVKKETTLPKLTYTYTKKGNYNASVVAKDDRNEAATSKVVNILPGTEFNFTPAQMVAINGGKAIFMANDCKACHKISEKSIGPAFTEVAKKYPNNPASKTHLSNKIVQGGTGVWGDVVMPAHPNLKPADTKKIMAFIFSLKRG
jgi:cytochrome c551/c552